MAGAPLQILLFVSTKECIGGASGAKRVKHTKSGGKIIEQKIRSGKEKKMYRKEDKDFNLRQSVLVLIQRSVVQLVK